MQALEPFLNLRRGEEHLPRKRVANQGAGNEVGELLGRLDAGQVPPEVARVVGLLPRMPAASRRTAARGLGLLLAGTAVPDGATKPRRKRPGAAR